ncbi:ATP-binding protein [Parachitinimonas caeni]|uniref:histidine kinase n=1 Tax=Parachitinimonas caeni TaxID=3031301 RepID=A0ABT7DYT2_9NEIS|nr:ATP-binding protein [Parachitinimonas caeni]MDK2125218.1 ATP-binding protein [Parachitinimonas caeni]
MIWQPPAIRAIRSWLRASIARRFGVASALLAIAVSITVTLTLAALLYALVHASLDDDSQTRARLVIRNSRALLDGAAEDLHLLAQHPGLLQALQTPSQQSDTLQAIVRSHRVAGVDRYFLLLADVHGQHLATKQAGITDYTSLLSGWFRQQGLRFVTRGDNTWIIMVEPVTNPATGKTDGYLRLELDLSHLLLTQLQALGPGTRARISRDGLIIAQYGSTLDAESHVHGDTLTFGRHDWLKSRETSHYETTLDVFIGDHSSHLSHFWTKFLLPGIFAAGLTGTTAYVIAYRQARRLTETLSGLASTADSISTQSDIPIDLPAAGNDEVGQLSTSLRTMLERLRRYQEGLELRVNENTRNLQETEQRFRTMADSAPVLIWVADPNGLCSYVNQPWLSFTGRDMDQEHGEGWLDTIQPLDRARYREMLTYIASGHTASMELRARRRDGTQRWMLARGTPRLGDDAGVGSVGCWIDITERRDAELALGLFKRLLDDAHDFVAIIDPHSATLNYANRSLLNAAGLVHLPIHTILPVALCRALSAEQLTEYLHRLEGTERWIGIESTLSSDADEGVPVELAIEKVIGVNDQVLLVVFGRDISERRRMDQLKADFIATVSHELRTPLTSIKGGLSLVLNGVLGKVDERIQGLLQIAFDNSERLLLLINDLLDIEKLEAGQMPLQITDVDIVALVEQAARANEAYARQFGVVFNLNLPLDHKLETIGADQHRLSQVMANLLSNAAKFSNPGQTVQVTVQEVDDAIKVSVHNWGDPIPAAFRDKVFQRFSQADNSAIRKRGGTGLGLSISKAIIERHGGSMAFRSEAGDGTTFWFSIPRPGLLHF